MDLKRYGIKEVEELPLTKKEREAVKEQIFNRHIHGMTRSEIVRTINSLPHDGQKANILEGTSELPRDLNGMYARWEEAEIKGSSEMGNTIAAYTRFERSIRELDTRKRPFYSRSTMAKMVQNAIDKLEEDLTAIDRKGAIKHGG